uniref:Uncharacterized protein n=1 Tax=Rhodnius prolixus TaxID=13249 RepID=T1HLI5_RHOPR
MKKYTVLMLSILIVYSECLPLKDSSKEVKVNADTALSEFRPETDDSARATTVKAFLESNAQPAVVTEKTIYDHEFWNNFVKAMKVDEVSPHPVGAAINAIELCDSGFQKGPSGKCRRVFG